MTGDDAPRSVLLLGGATGAGKTSVANAIANRRMDTALVEYDTIHAMMPRPMLAFWKDQAGLAQRLHVEDLVQQLIVHFTGRGHHVMVTDVLTDEIVSRYRDGLGSLGITVVTLRLSRAVNYQRFASRRWRALSDDDWDAVYSLSASVTDVDGSFDADTLSIEDTASIVERFWMSQ